MRILQWRVYMEIWKAYSAQINDLYSSHFKQKPIFTKIFFYCFTFGEIISIKTFYPGI